MHTQSDSGLTWWRAPAHTAIRYILQGLDPVAVEAAFGRHAAQLHAACTGPGQGSIALDGKTLRGSFDTFNDQAAAQILSAFATDTALVLAHADIAEKSSEIPAAQALLAELGLASGSIVTLDALHCKKLFECAAEAKVTLIVQVKDNQRTLLQQGRNAAAANQPLTMAHSHTQSRNRHERRTVSVFDPADTLAATPWQLYVAARIRVEQDVFTRNPVTGLLRKTTESDLCVCNAPVSAEHAGAAIRAHWAIENTSHYTRNATLGEDRSHIRTNPACSPACAASRSISTKPTAPKP